MASMSEVILQMIRFSIYFKTLYMPYSFKLKKKPMSEWHMFVSNLLISCYNMELLGANFIYPQKQT